LVVLVQPVVSDDEAFQAGQVRVGAIPGDQERRRVDVAELVENFSKYLKLCFFVTNSQHSLIYDWAQ
jgi:hypothetical protein